MTNYPPGWYGFAEDGERLWLYCEIINVWGMRPDGSLSRQLDHPSLKPVFLFEDPYQQCTYFLSDGHRWAWPDLHPNNLDYPIPRVEPCHCFACCKCSNIFASIEDRIAIRGVIMKYCRREVLEIS